MVRRRGPILSKWYLNKVIFPGLDMTVEWGSQRVSHAGRPCAALGGVSTVEMEWGLWLGSYRRTYIEPFSAGLTQGFNTYLFLFAFLSTPYDHQESLQGLAISWYLSYFSKESILFIGSLTFNIEIRVSRALTGHSVNPGVSSHISTHLWHRGKLRPRAVKRLP